MEDKQQFARILEQVRKTAIEQGGYIEKSRVEEAFGSFGLQEEQISMVYDYLKKHNIGIGEPLEASECLSPEEQDFLKQYMEEIQFLGQVEEEERRKIVLRAAEGDKSAEKRLLEIFLRDVAEIARLYTGQGVFLEDLIGEGNVALAKGVEQVTGLVSGGGKDIYEEVQGRLGKMIMDAMEEYIQRNNALKKADQDVADKINEITDKARELSEALRRKITSEELSKETGIPLAEIKEAVKISGFQIEYIED